MTYKYSICYPDKKEIEYRNTPIFGKEVIEIAENYPWIDKLNFSDTLHQEEVHYSPSIDFTCIQNGVSLGLTAHFGKDKNLEFSLWYNRPKKVKLLFGLFGKKEKMLVDDAWSFSLEESILYLKYFINGDYSKIESLYKK